MGITGLLPFLKKSSRVCNLSEFKGQTVAIDAYCWLHKGAFACAEKLVKGEPTDGYIVYVMKLVNMLLSFNIKPILVFDGCHLPSKSVTEKKRHENRAKNRQKAKELLREGKIKEARECFQRCVDVTSAMARDVINACRARNIDTIVAPFEADAQLAFLSQSGIADLIITEDSDLVIFGCNKILFKMDSNGGGVLIENEKLHMSMNIPRDRFNFEKFRNVCILSGCDYLPSLHGIGLVKACRFFNVTSNPDVFSALCKLPSNLKMPHLQVTLEYREGFIRAINTILYQLVFDPLTRTLRPLTPYPPNKDSTDFPYCGEFMGHEKSLQIALGNMDIQTYELVDNYTPPKEALKQPVGKSLGWNSKKDEPSRHPSIWLPNYLSLKENLLSCSKEKKDTARMVGKEQTVVCNFKRKRPEPVLKEEDASLSEGYLENLYSDNCPKKFKDCDLKVIEDMSNNLTPSVEHLSNKETESLKTCEPKEEQYFKPELKESKIAKENCIGKVNSAVEAPDLKVPINPFAKRVSHSPFTKIVHSRYFVSPCGNTKVKKEGEFCSEKLSPVKDCKAKLNLLHARNDKSPEEVRQSSFKGSEECDDETEAADLTPRCHSGSSQKFIPSIFDTPPASQNKENLSRFFSKLDNSLPVVSADSTSPALTVNTTPSAFKTSKSSIVSSEFNSRKQVTNGHQLFSSWRSPPTASSVRQSPSLATSGKCRAPGLRKGDCKKKQLNLKDMFGFKK